MITVTAAAAQQIKDSAKQSQAEGLPLRIAATRQADGSLHYAMGFAEEDTEKDLSYVTEGITIVVSPVSLNLVDNTTIDYVEMDDGEMNFIFKNPNDPNYKPAQ